MWCAGRADSREHAIPKWMSKRLGINEQMFGRSSQGLPRVRHPISFASYRKRIFCKGCNTHFKHLEDEAIPLIEPMAWGRTAVSLGAEGQRLLALWAAKTGMALLAATKLTDAIPQTHRDSVRHHAQPPADSWVGYFPWTGGPNVWAAEGDMATNTPNPAFRGDTYTVIFAFRRLAFMLVGFRDPIPAGYRIGSGTYPIHQVWPTQASLIHWPPDEPPANAGVMPDLVRFAPLDPIAEG
jgi:hypothetical protein